MKEGRDLEHEKDAAWTKLCTENGWICRICGAVPERGSDFRTRFAMIVACGYEMNESARSDLRAKEFFSGCE